MNAIELVTPRPPQNPDLETLDVLVGRLPDGRIAVAIKATSDNGPVITMPQEVFDKLALAVVRFVQSEAVKSKSE